MPRRPAGRAADPNGLPGTSVSNTAQINYFNYSLNARHHYTGLPWLDATTSAGSSATAGASQPGDGRLQPARRRQRADRRARCRTTSSTRPSSSTSRSTARSSCSPSTLGSRSRAASRRSGPPTTATSASSTTTRTTRPRTACRTFVSFIDDFKLRAAYGQSGNLAPYGAEYTPLNPTLDRRRERHRQQSALGRPEHQAGIGDGDRARHSTRRCFKSRAQFTATVYQKRLTNLLLQAGVAPSYGYTNRTSTAASSRTRASSCRCKSTPMQLRNGFTWVHTTSVLPELQRRQRAAGPAVLPWKTHRVRRRLSRAGSVGIGDCEPQHHRGRTASRCRSAMRHPGSL